MSSYLTSLGIFQESGDFGPNHRYFESKTSQGFLLFHEFAIVPYFPSDVYFLNVIAPTNRPFGGDCLLIPRFFFSKS